MEWVCVWGLWRVSVAAAWGAVLMMQHTVILPLLSLVAALAPPTIAAH